MTTTLDEIVEFPDTDGLEDGDICVDAATGSIYALKNGVWTPANVRQVDDARATFARHEKGLAVSFIREGTWP